MTYIRPGTFGGVIGAQGELVFEWNKTDITQFNGAAPVFADQLAGDASLSTLSVVALAERGNALRFAANPGATDMFAVWLVTAPVVFPDTRRDLVITAEIAEGSGMTLNDSAHGPAFLFDSLGKHGFSHMIGNREKGWTINTGPEVAAGGNTVGDARGGWQRHTIRGDKPAGAAPHVTSFLDFWDETTHSQFARRSGSSVNARGNIADLGSNSVLGATWNSLALDRVGWCLGSDNGQVGPVSVDILDLRVYLVRA